MAGEKTYFITGFPGFIAGELIKEAVKRDLFQHVYVLVLPEMAEQAEIQLAEIAPGKGTVIKGDITKEQLGIEPETRRILEQTVTHVYHLAAIYDLGVEREAAFLVNVKGTICVNRFVKSLQSLELYTYFSTAYVSGKREGKIFESELEPAEFKNFYEETKWLAEKEVRSLQKEVPAIIIRPGIVVGHSKTGKTVKFDGPYYMLQLFQKLRYNPFIPALGKGDVPFHLIPVDYLIQAVLYLSQSGRFSGKTFHITDPDPLPIGKVYELFLEKSINMKPIGRVSPQLMKKCFSSDALCRYFQVRKEAFDYFIYNADYDCTNTAEALKGTAISCPSIVSYSDAMIQFFKENQNQPIQKGVKAYAGS